MPPVDFREDAKARENAKLRRAGLNPDGSPMKKPKPGADNGDDDDDDGDNGETDEERQARLAAEREDETDEEREERERQEADDDDDDGEGDGNVATRAEILRLQRQLDAMEGRVAPAQRSADEYQRLYTGERQERERETRELNDQLAALRTQLEERDENFDAKDLLSQEELEDIDPKVIDVVMKLAKGIAKKMTPKVNARAEALSVLAERDAQRVVAHRTHVLTDPARGLHQLSTLAYDPKFIEWSQGEDNDIDSVMNSLLNAKSTEEVDRYAKIVAKRIARFKEAAKGKQPPADPTRSLQRHMQRKPGARMTRAEADAKFLEAKQLSRSGNPADRAKAKKILDSLQ